VVEASVVLELERITERLFVTTLDLHSGHGLDWIAKSKGQEKVRFRELAAEYKKP